MQGWHRVWERFRASFGSKTAVVAGCTVVVVAFAATVVYAATTVTAPDSDGVIHACYKTSGKGVGKVRLVTKDTPCKSTETAISWQSFNSFNEFDGMACMVNDTPGTIALSFDGNNVATFTCDTSGGGGGPELCNGVDDNGNGQTDEGYNLGGACTSGGPGQCQAAGVIVCDGSGGAMCDAVGGTPTTEICNGLDDDCDASTDEGFNVGAMCDAGGGPNSGVTQCSVDGQGTTCEPN